MNNTNNISFDGRNVTNAEIGFWTKINTNMYYSRSDRIRKLWKYRFLFLMLFPALVAMILFHYIPLPGIIVAFQDYRIKDGIFGSKWVGLENFKTVFEFRGLLNALKNDIIFGIYGFCVSFPSTIAFALLLNEIRNSKIKRSIQTITYLPTFLSTVIICGWVVEFLSPNRGIINQILRYFGVNSIYFLTEPKYFKTIIVFTGLWSGIGMGSVIYLASIANVNPELYDVAIVDGANRFRRMIHVTLPAMIPAIMYSFIFSMTGIIFGGNFSLIYNLMNTITRPVGEIVDVIIFENGLAQNQWSFGAAVGIMKSIVNFIMLAIANFISRRVSEFSLW